MVRGCFFESKLFSGALQQDATQIDPTTCVYIYFKLLFGSEMWSTQFNLGRFCVFDFLSPIYYKHPVIQSYWVVL